MVHSYRESCTAAYRGLVQPEAEDKRVISATWAKDEDISRFLQNLPNWERAKLGIPFHTDEESPEEVRQRTQKEAEILTGNLGETEIPLHEILGDIQQFRSLASLQFSMEWFANELAKFEDCKPPSNATHSLKQLGDDIQVRILDKVLKNTTQNRPYLKKNFLLKLWL